MLGWPDYQRGQVALIWLVSRPLVRPTGKTVRSAHPRDARRLWRVGRMLSRLAGDHPDMFRMESCPHWTS